MKKKTLFAQNNMQCILKCKITQYLVVGVIAVCITPRLVACFAAFLTFL